MDNSYYLTQGLGNFLVEGPIHSVINYQILGSLNKFPDFFRMGTFIDSTHVKLYFPSK